MFSSEKRTDHDWRSRGSPFRLVCEVVDHQLLAKINFAGAGWTKRRHYEGVEIISTIWREPPERIPGWWEAEARLAAGRRLKKA
jgi:hypothetical protein